MANLVLSFNTVPNAVTYKITYSWNGSTPQTVYTTTSPWTLTDAECGNYTGTVAAICDEGEVCTQYMIMNPSMDTDGDVSYTDCTTGNLTTQAVTYGANFTICSRDVPQTINGAQGTTVTPGNICGSNYNVVQSPDAVWNLTVSCYNYYLVTPCDPGAPVPANNEVRSSVPLVLSTTVVELLGSLYAGYYYTITDVGGPQTSAVLVGTVYSNSDCNSVTP